MSREASLKRVATEGRGQPVIAFALFFAVAKMTHALPNSCLRGFRQGGNMRFSFLARPLLAFQILLLPALFFFTLSFLVLSPSYALAKQEPRDDDRQMPLIVVSGSAEPVHLASLGAKSQIITRQQIEKTKAKTLSQLLQRTTATSLSIQPGNYTRFSLRGFSSGKSTSALGDPVLLLIDGNRAGTGNLDNIPLAGVERVEIFSGAGAYLYGGSAVGGVVNIVTTQGEDYWDGRIATEYGSFDKRSLSAGASGASEDNRFGLSFAVQGNAASDYEDGHGQKYANTHYNKAGGMLRASFRPSEKTNFSSTGVLHKVYDTGSPSDIFNPTPNDSISNDYGHGALSFDHSFEQGARVAASLYGSQNVYEYIARDGWYLGNSIYDDRILGAKTTLSLPLEIGEIEENRLSFGAEVLEYKQELRGNNVWSPDSSTDVYSVFVEHRLQDYFLNIITGARYDYYNFSAGDNSKVSVASEDKNFEQLTWGVKGIYWLLGGFGLRAGVDTAYVPPTAMQMVGNYHMAGTTYRANPDLEAEKSVTLSTGLEVEADFFKLSFGYFYTRYKDHIALEYSGSRPNSYADSINKGNLQRAGLEGMLNFTYDFKLGEEKLTVSPYSSWEVFTSRTDPAHGDIRRTQTDLPRYTALAGLGLGYDIFWLDVNMQMVGSHVGNDFSAGRYDEYKKFSGFEIFNARLGVSPTENLEVYLQVDNIADKYYGYKPEFPMPGRTISLGCALTF